MNSSLLQDAEAAPRPETAGPARRFTRDAIQTGLGLVGVRIASVVLATSVTVAVALSADPALRASIVVGIILAIAVLGNSAITGLLGEISLSASATMAVAAFTAAHLVSEGQSVERAVLTAIVLSTVVSMIIAIPTVRLHGIFAALATFALAFSVPTMAVYLKEYTGGDNGIGLPYPSLLFGIDVSGSTTGAVLVPATIFAVLAIVSVVVMNSQLGWTALLVGESPTAADSFGIWCGLVKVLVWTWAGLLSSVAGVLYALNLGYISPLNFEARLGILLLVAGVVAGVRSAWGALVAGLLVGTLPPQIQDWVPATATGLVFGLVLLAALASGRDLARWVESGCAATLALARRRSSAGEKEVGR